MLRRPLRHLLTLALVACGSDGTAPPDSPDDPGPPVVASVAVTPTTVTFQTLFDTVRASAVARTAAGAVVAGASVTWTSLDTLVARVDASGLITSVGFGTGSVRASVAGVSGGSPVTVVTDVGVEQGAVEAYAFRDPAAPGGLRLHRTAAAGAGLQPAAGAQVSVTGSSATDRARASGYLRLGRLTPGLSRLTITDGTQQRQIPLTLIANAAVNAGETPVTRSAAAALALAAAAPRDPNRVWLFAPQQPLPAGTTVGPSVVGAAGVVTTLSATSWVFYLDDNPRARFQKPVRYLVVDASTGAVTSFAATSAPTFNGRVYYRDAEANLTSPDAVRSPAWGAPAAPARTPGPPPPSAAPETAVEAQAHGLPSYSAAPEAAHAALIARTFGINVLGDARDDFRSDSDRLFELVEHDLGGTSFRYTPPREAGEVRDPIASIGTWFGQICGQAGPDDTVVLSLHTHGTRGGDVEITTSRNDDGSRAGLVTWHPESLPWNTCNAGRIIIWADVCYSGMLAQRMQEFVQRSPQIFAGKEVVILASSATDEVSGGETAASAAGAGLTRGGYFTNTVLGELGSLSNGLGTDQLVQAYERAAPKVLTLTTNLGFISADQRIGQHTRVYRRPIAPGERKNPDGSVTQWGAQIDLPGRGPTRVPLARIVGWRLAPLHVPVTSTNGCEYDHIHLALGFTGLLVTMEDGTVVGPIPDPLPPFCGFGRILDIPFPVGPTGAGT